MPGAAGLVGLAARAPAVRPPRETVQLMAPKRPPLVNGPGTGFARPKVPPTQVAIALAGVTAKHEAAITNRRLPRAAGLRGVASPQLQAAGPRAGPQVPVAPGVPTGGVVRLKRPAGDGPHARRTGVAAIERVRRPRPRVRGVQVGVAAVGVAPTTVARVAAAPAQALPLTAAATRGRVRHPPVARGVPPPFPEVPTFRTVVHAPRPARVGPTGAGQVAPKEVRATPSASTHEVPQANAPIPAGAGTAGAPVHVAAPIATAPAQAGDGLAARRRLPRAGLPHRREPAVGIVAGVPPLLAVAALVAVQVSKTAVGTPLSLVLVGPPPAPLARGLRGRARPAVLAPPEVAVPQRAFGAGTGRSGLPPRPSAGVSGGPQAPLERPGAGLLRVLRAVAGQPLQAVVHAPHAPSALVGGAPRAPRRPLRGPHAGVVLRGKVRPRAGRGRGPA